MISINLENGKYVDLVLIPPSAPDFAPAIRLEFGDQSNPDFADTYLFSIKTDSLGSFLAFLHGHRDDTFFEFRNDPKMFDPKEPDLFRFEEGGDFLSVFKHGKEKVSSIPLCFHWIVLFEALKDCCKDALKGSC